MLEMTECIQKIMNINSLQAKNMNKLKCVNL